MPVHIDTDRNPRRPTDFEDTKFERMNFDDEYKHLYPEGVNLRPGKPAHDRLKEEILLRARESERWMSNRHPDWTSIDHMLTGYIPLDADEKDVKSKDIRKPVSIVVPESFAILDTILSYMMTAFGPAPIFRYDGEGPEDIIGAILLEKTVEVQTKKMKTLLGLHTHWRDAFSYGFGVAALSWKVKMGKRSVVNPTGFFTLNGEFTQTGSERIIVDSILYEGSDMHVIDPYRYLPDPSVAIHDVQSGEYVGWKDSSNFPALLRDENEPGSVFFNIKYLQNIPGQSAIYLRDASGRQDKISLPTTEGIQNDQTRPFDTVSMYIDLIPNEWDLPPGDEDSDGDTPEKWMFVLAADEVIIAAAPMGLHHNMFPVVVSAPDSGGHELMPLSRIEMMFGLQEVINFYFNSHMRNVRKALNNMFVVDPKIVNMNDVLNPSDGKVIRLRPPVWGRGVKDGIAQLKVDDVTSGHIADMEAARNLARHTTGAQDSLQGIQRTGGERVTKAEFSSTRGSAISRLQKAAQIISLQSMQDLSLMYAYHTQQFMSAETYVKIAGRQEEVLRREYGIAPGDTRVKVTPFDLNVAFDVVTSDGSIERGDNATEWIQLYGLMSNNPELVEALDSTRIFLHIARLLGADDAQEFLRSGRPVNTTVVPDAEAAAAAQAGNIVPLGEAGAI